MPTNLILCQNPRVVTTNVSKSQLGYRMCAVWGLSQTDPLENPLSLYYYDSAGQLQQLGTKVAIGQGGVYIDNSGQVINDGPYYDLNDQLTADLCYGEYNLSGNEIGSQISYVPAANFKSKELVPDTRSFQTIQEFAQDGNLRVGQTVFIAERYNRYEIKIGSANNFKTISAGGGLIGELIPRKTVTPFDYGAVDDGSSINIPFNEMLDDARSFSLRVDIPDPDVGWRLTESLPDDAFAINLSRAGVYVYNDNEFIESNTGFDNQAKHGFTRETSDKPVFLLWTQSGVGKFFTAGVCATGSGGWLQTVESGNVSPADANNTGGNDIVRITSCFTLDYIIAATLNSSNNSDGVTKGTFINAAEWDYAVGIGANSSNQGNFSNRSSSFTSKETYNANGANEYIEFETGQDCEVLFYGSSTSSTSVEVQTDESGSFVTKKTVDLSFSGAIRVAVETSNKVRILNNVSANCYVIGANVDRTRKIKLSAKYDSFHYSRRLDIAGQTAQFIGPSPGANDMAWRRSGSKFFGSYHGGHSNESVSVNADGIIYDNVNPPVNGNFVSCVSTTMTSNSDLSDGTVDYNCFYSANFTGYGHNLTVDIKTKDFSKQKMEQMYSGMTIAPIRFVDVTTPESFRIDRENTDDDTQFPITLGNTVVQTDPTRRQSIRTRFTVFDYQYTELSGPFVQKRVGDNKFYNDPLYFSNERTEGAKFNVERTFYS